MMRRKATTSMEKTTTAVTKEAAKALADWPEEVSACPLMMDQMEKESWRTLKNVLAW